MRRQRMRWPSASLVLFVICIATPTFQQQAQPIFYGNPAAFQYQQTFPASNYAPNNAPSVFVPFQSRQSSSSHRRDFFGQEIVPQQPPAVFQPSRFSYQQQQQDRLAPPQRPVQQFAPEQPSFFPTQRRVPSAQSEVSFTGPSSRTRYETPTGRKLSSQTDSFNNFPRAPEIPQPVEDNIYDPRELYRVRGTTERSSTPRQTTGLRRFKPGSRSQPGSKNNVLTLNKNIEDPTSTPRAHRVRVNPTGVDQHRSRYRVIPSRFKTRPSASEEPPYEEPSSTTSSTASPLDYSRDYHPTVSYIETSTPPLSVPSAEYEFAGIPEADFSSPSGPSAPTGPSGSQEQQPSSPDYDGQYDYEVSEPSQPEAPSAPQKNETYEVITMKPDLSLVADENFDGFVDSTLIDNTPKKDEKTATEASSKGVSVSVHTAVSTVPKPTTPIPEAVETQSKTNLESPPTSDPEVNVTNSTESWVVVASVQTSRSVSGARFIPFHTGIKQDEKVLPSLQSNKLESTTSTSSSAEPSVTEPVVDEKTKEESTTTSTSTSTASTTTTTTTTTTTEPPLFERKFSPAPRPQKAKSRVNQSLLDSIQFDDLGPSLLPPGFKPRQGQNSFRNRPVTTTTESSASSASSSAAATTTTGRTSPVVIESVDPALLPPGFKFSPNNAPPSEGTEATTRSSGGFKPKAKHNATATSLRPFSGKALNTTTKTNDVSSTKQKSENLFASLLPPGYKLDVAKEETPLVALLPPGFKVEPDKVEVGSSVLADILSKAKPVDLSSLLPPGFKPPGAAAAAPTTAAPAATVAAPKSHVPHVPKPGSGARKPFGGFRFTSPKPETEDGGGGGDGGGDSHQGETSLSTPKIQKGWPTRATTDFTGWPTPPTTPLSAEKILEMASRTTTTTTTTTTTEATTTTTSTTTTPRPTTPGICTSECQLAGTIRLTDGAQWVPELIDRNTAEYKSLAANITAELKSAYEKSDSLNKLFRNVWIDGFNKGSVLVDYIVQLDTQAKEFDTQQLKTMFHDSLGHPYAKQSAALEAEAEDSGNDISSRPRALQLGKFEIDPDFTDFIVLPPSAEPTPLPTQEDEFLPQWAIAVIVIGLASLLFVIIFGVSVLINRQQAQQSKQPVILSDAMLNELGKDHMGGYDNMAAVDDIYGLDGWEARPRDHEPKYASKRAKSAHGNGGMGYDSWRSDWNGYYYGGSANGAFYNKGPGGPGSHSSGGRRSRMPDYDTNF